MVLNYNKQTEYQYKVEFVLQGKNCFYLQMIDKSICYFFLVTLTKFLYQLLQVNSNDFLIGQISSCLNSWILSKDK